MRQEDHNSESPGKCRTLGPGVSSSALQFPPLPVIGHNGPVLDTLPVARSVTDAECPSLQAYYLPNVAPLAAESGLSRSRSLSCDCHELPTEIAAARMRIVLHCAWFSTHRPNPDTRLSPHVARFHQLCSTTTKPDIG